MSVLGNVINWILGLGAAIFVPIIIIIAGLVVGMKLKDAISAGITLGVAYRTCCKGNVNTHRNQLTNR